MKNLIHNAFRVLGLRRSKPATRLGGVRRRANHLFSALALVYLFLHVFPQVIFRHVVEIDGVRVYSTDRITGDPDPTIRVLASRVRSSPLHDERDAFSLFVCNSRKLYSLFSPLSPGSFGCSIPFTDRIFLARADVCLNQASSFSSEYNRRSFVSVAEHEIGHVMMRKRFGLLTDRLLPTWLKEGYCETLAGESSFPEKEGDLLLSQGKTGGVSLQYLLYRRMVEYLMTEQKLTAAQLVAHPPKRAATETATRQWLREKATKPSR